MCLPQRITTPDRASSTKLIAMVQCVVRSTALKRSISRPVGAPCTLIGPLQRKNARSTRNAKAKSQPPYRVSGPLRKARHSRPEPWIRRLVSRPGTEAYCGRSLHASQDSGGLFHPGAAVEPAPGLGGSTCGATGTLPAFLVGAVTGASLL